jgi:ATP-dependent RNA helicase HelY
MHHAGMLPYLKELIEELFQQGLIKVVFATETLSLGIHMPARAVVVSSFTKFDGVNFASLTSGELTQLMGRAGRRGIDPLGHGVILKEPDVEVGTIYEAAVGEEMTVVSKFAPTYNMALNLLRFYPPADVDQLMERSFGQYQRRNALQELDERVAILRRRLADLTAMPSPCCSERTIASFLHSKEAINSLRGRLRRGRRDHWREGRRGRRGRRTPGPGGESTGEMREELRTWVAKRDQLPCGTCPHLADHTAHHQELRRLQVQVRSAEQEAEQSTGEYRRRMASIRAILADLGFLADSKPTEKGLLASRIYGENSLIITQAIEDGWLQELQPAELAAALVMVTAEDRGRDRVRARPKFPTAEVALAHKRLRVIFFRFSGRERDRGEDTLRPLSTDYVQFTYDWASGIPLTEMDPPGGVDLGDAIKALKGLYSALRQIEWAVVDRPAFHDLVRKSRASLERDLITRV